MRNNYLLCNSKSLSIDRNVYKKLFVFFSVHFLNRGNNNRTIKTSTATTNSTKPTEICVRGRAFMVVDSVWIHEKKKITHNNAQTLYNMYILNRFAFLVTSISFSLPVCLFVFHCMCYVYRRYFLFITSIIMSEILEFGISLANLCANIFRNTK